MTTIQTTRDNLRAAIRTLKLDPMMETLATSAVTLASDPQVMQIAELWADIKQGKFENAIALARQVGVPDTLIQRLQATIPAHDPE